MADILSSIGINPVSLAGQMVSFLILLFAFKKFLFGPILENLDKRAKKQAEAVKAAEETIRLKQELEEKQAKMQKKLSEDIKKEFAKAEKQAASRKEELIQRAREEAKLAASRQYEEFDKKLQSREKEVRKHLSDLVIKTTRQILSQHLSQTVEKEIVASEIKELEKIKI